jgi:hypothetical protein
LGWRCRFHVVKRSERSLPTDCFGLRDPLYRTFDKSTSPN